VGPHGGFQITIRAGDETDVGVDDLLAPDRRELAVLQHVQKLGLESERHLADLVEHQRPAVGCLELPRLLTVRAREGALLVSEELGLQQLTRQRGAIHLEELLACTGRRPVQRVGHHFLAHAALATEQHGGVGRSNLRDEIADRLHLRAAAELKPFAHRRPSTVGVRCRCVRTFA
jgi:hypothetical protein